MIEVGNLKYTQTCLKKIYVVSCQITIFQHGMKTTILPNLSTMANT